MEYKTQEMNKVKVFFKDKVKENLLDFNPLIMMQINKNNLTFNKY